MIDEKLIYDLGLHRGEDAEFYLKKGFRVVGVDANPEMCKAAAERLSEYVSLGQLVIINKAISESSGYVTFFKNAATSEWGTVSPQWAERNKRMGAPSSELRVETIQLAEVFDTYGVPYYLKIDLEGMDTFALKSLLASRDRPTYVSIESNKISFADLRAEFELFSRLGFDRFKVVPQHKVPKQRPPFPSKEGEYVNIEFEWGSSGLFGEEAPGEWISAEEAIDRYKTIFLRYDLVGDDPLLRSGFTRRLLRRLGVEAGWYDTHARHSGARS